MTGAEVRRLRKRLGLTQEAFGAQLGTTGNTVARWERDEVGVSTVVARLMQFVAHSAQKQLPTKTGAGRTRPR